MTMTLLDTAVIGAQQGQLGYLVWNGYNYIFVPLSEIELASLPETTLFVTPAQVTGQIIQYQVNINGTFYDWGAQAQVGQEFELRVVARYASTSPKCTKVIASVYGPSGILKYTLSCTDNWPYGNPNTNIEFNLTGPFGEAYDIDEAGTWTAALSYVWVH